ncbi:MAG: TetR/AcrR family transcriptional regulator [Lachnospiraceae bacterium]|nr:TetR/AcrR family transcriptional regulator [Lachnospiraceae bacterium]
MDARVRMTKMMIRNTFFDLLKECPIERITVKSICEGAGINRATFYKYYENPYDLLDKLEEEFLSSLQEEIVNSKTRSLSQLFRIVLNDIVEKKDIYLTLFSENGDEMFKKSLFDLVYVDNMKHIKKDYPNLSQTGQTYLFYYIAEGCTGVVNRWINDGMKENPEEIAGFLEKFVYSIDKSKL